MKNIYLWIIFVALIPAYYGFVSGFAGINFLKDPIAYSLINAPALIMSFALYGLLVAKKDQGKT